VTTALFAGVFLLPLFGSVHTMKRKKKEGD
jgi:hypothetical protein